MNGFLFDFIESNMEINCGFSILSPYLGQNVKPQLPPTLFRIKVDH